MKKYKVYRAGISVALDPTDLAYCPTIYVGSVALSADHLEEIEKFGNFGMDYRSINAVHWRQLHLKELDAIRMEAALSGKAYKIYK